MSKKSPPGAGLAWFVVSVTPPLSLIFSLAYVSVDITVVVFFGISVRIAVGIVPFAVDNVVEDVVNKVVDESVVISVDNAVVVIIGITVENCHGRREGDGEEGRVRESQGRRNE